MKGRGLRNDLPMGAQWGLGLRWDLTPLVLLGFHGQCLPSDWVDQMWGGVASFSFQISPNWLHVCPMSVHRELNPDPEKLSNTSVFPHALPPPCPWHEAVCCPSTPCILTPGIKTLQSVISSNLESSLAGAGAVLSYWPPHSRVSFLLFLSKVEVSPLTSRISQLEEEQ